MIKLFRPYLGILSRLPGDRWRIVVLVVLMTLAAGLEAMGLGAVMPFVDLVQHRLPGPPFLWLARVLEAVSSDPTRRVAAAGLLLIVVFLVKNIYLAASNAVQMRFVYRRMVAVEKQLLAHYLSRPFEFHLRTNSAELVRNVIAETGVIFQGPMASLFIVAAETITLAVIVIMLTFIEPVAVPGAGLVVGVLAYGMQRFYLNKLARAGAASRDFQTSMLLWASQAIGGVKEIKVLGREAFFVEQFEKAVAGQAEALREYRITTFVPRYVLESLGVVGLVVVSLVVLSRGGTAEELLPLLGVVALAVVRLLPSLARVSAALTDIRFYGKAATALAADLAQQDREEPVRGRAEAGDPIRPTRDVALTGVTFTYKEASRPALADVSLRVAIGEAVALVGPSGAGKTTLVDTAIGLLTPTTGTFDVDGRPLDPHELRRWQRSIGYIPQNIFLIDDTLAANIALGVPPTQIDRARLTAAIRGAHLEDFVRELPEGLATRVGERGARFSGGQRQRVGIARALYVDATMLVLDEATSALDGATEREVVEAIDALRPTRIVLVVAHRLSTVRHCDRLAYMDSGRIVDMGTWDELITRCAPFRVLVAAGGLADPVGPDLSASADADATN